MKTLTDNLNLNILELFSVLLPGAVTLMFLNQICFLHSFSNEIIPNNNDWAEGIGYFAASYFVGYIVYVLSSYLDEWFGKLKDISFENTTYNETTLKFELKNKKWWAEIIFNNIDSTFELMGQILPIKYQYLGYYEKKPISAFQWSYRRLMIEENTTMLMEVERYQATAKFFRSMSIVWVLAILIMLFTDGIEQVELLIPLILLIISLLTYLNRQQKALQVAFKNVIILEKYKKTKSKSSNKPMP